jgi:CHAT domain-containing protein
VTSYIPTLTALLKARRTLRAPLRSECNMLVVAEPFAPNLEPLPYVPAEVDIVLSLFPTGSVINASATTAAQEDVGDCIDVVLKGLQKATLLHLACHGVQDEDDPLDSGFWLRDGRLTLARLMQLNLPDAYFAFLSACETAKGDVYQPNQAVHLAAAMLFVGFRSVIGTMW